MHQIIDTHCHIYPDAIADRAVAGIGNFYHAPIVCDGRVATLLTEGAQAGVTQFVVCSVATTPHQVDSINRFIADAVQQHPDVLYGMGALHPDSEDQAADVRQVLALGLRGIKLHPDIQQIQVDDPRYLKIFELCEGKLPVLCHLGDARYDYSNPNRVKHVLELFPHLQLIGAHFGGWSVWAEAAKELHAYPNLMVDCSSSLFSMTPEEGARLVRTYGADRVLFGTDYPMWRADEELARFNAMPLTDAEREQILFQNAARLYEIPVG